MKSRLVSVFVLFAAVSAAIGAGSNDDPSPNLYSSYIGEWIGKFYVYTPDGKLLKSMAVHHVYRESGKYTLEGTQTVTYDDGSKENVQVKDYVEAGKLFCRVQSDRFGLKILEGRMEGNQIFWWRTEKGVIESYRE
ncbi:hypothetical protein L0156_27085, partial [bacterium]|nr:hypothetical protein [bacterium]